MKKLTTFALLFALMLSLFGCSTTETSSVSPEINDSKDTSIDPIIGEWELTYFKGSGEFIPVSSLSSEYLPASAVFDKNDCIFHFGSESIEGTWSFVSIEEDIRFYSIEYLNSTIFYVGLFTNNHSIMGDHFICTLVDEENSGFVYERC